MVDFLIAGGDSALAKSLTGRLRGGGADVAITSRRRTGETAHFLDLESLEGLDRLPPADAIVLMAAEVRNSVCAAEPERTQKINVEAPVKIAERALSQGSRVLFYSSIAVHDGSRDRPDESVPTNPNTLYGRQKREAEIRLLALGGDVLILRPSKVITDDFQLFHAWLESLRSGQAIAAFSDMKVSPVHADLVSELATKLLQHQGSRGIYQVCANDDTNYLEIARLIAAECGFDQSLVKSASASETLDHGIPWLSVNTCMDCSRLEELARIQMPEWQSAVRQFLAANL